MTHPDTQEVVGDSSFDLDDAAAALSKQFDDSAEDVEPEEEDLPDDLEEGDEPDDEFDDEEEDGEEEEPETAIQPPASLNAEEKAQFKQLPQEAQQMLAAVETRRNQQVTKATTDAANAQREAERIAAQAEVTAKAGYAEQLQAVLDAIAPQMPNPALAEQNPAQYIAEKAQYDAAIAQHGQFVQQVQALGHEASEEDRQGFLKDRDAKLMAFPEVKDEATRQEFFTKSFAAAEALGIDVELAKTKGTAEEFQRLRLIADWKDKADKFDGIQARKMSRVRAGKSAKANAAQPKGSGRSKAHRSARQRLSQTGDIDDAAAAIASMID